MSMASLSSHPLLVVAISCCLFVSALSSIVQPPLNDAVEFGPGATVTLTCGASGPTPRVQWTEYTTNPNGAPISDNEQILQGHPNSDRYEITRDGGTFNYNLKISDVQLEDGGRYRCIDISDASPPAYADIVTLGDLLNCTTNIPADGYTVEDSYRTIECVQTYRGNAAPNMTWVGPSTANGGDWGDRTILYEDTVFTGVAINISRYFNEEVFQLTANFSAQSFNFPGVPGSPGNAPTWSKTWQSPRLDVYWGPKSFTLQPSPENGYQVGTTIQCIADAWLPPIYFWQNLVTLARVNSAFLPATTDMIGTTPYRCNANNLEDNKDYFVNITVYPLTTQPTTTTQPPTTTTTPMAESACDNLSGRWLATSPTIADMCLEVDNNNNGQVTGIFRNATDPYFIDIRGLIAPHRYDQVGFSGVWPTTVGVLSFNGICRKCRGVEVLQVTGIGRRLGDGSECTDMGSYERFADYQFSRVGPPCRVSQDAEWSF